MPKIKIIQPGIVQSIQWLEDHLRIIDQTFLPEREFFQDIYEVGRVWEAIRSLRVRGAPAIGIAAAYGVYLGVRDLPDDGIVEFHTEVNRICEYLASSRPTAVNLQWALDQASLLSENMKGQPAQQVKQKLLDLAISIHENDKMICSEIGRVGQQLIPKKAEILTICNTGSLATGQFGTAFSMIYHAHLAGKDIHTWVCETRPLLQGSRLTTWELQKAEISHHLITDSMAGWVMKKKRVDMVLTGADRIARNGDTANKIGSYTLAILAKEHDIPFYVAAPLSTLDMNSDSGEDIPVEERDADEVRKVGGKLMAPGDTPVYNPAFDVTPHELITGIVTEKGIIQPDYRKNLGRVTLAQD